MDTSSPQLPRAIPPTVSIIIPTYNRTTWFKSAIQSALNQLHPKIEVIVVDDGSETQEAKDIVAAFPEARYFYQPNQGLGSARNLGTSLSAGEFILFLDDDDWLTPEAVNEKLDAFRINPELGAVYSDLVLVSDENKPIARYFEHRRRTPPSGDIYLDLLPRNFIPIHALLWRRSTVLEAGGFAEWSGAEDWYLLLHTAELAPFQYIDKVHGGYRIHEENMTRIIQQQTRGYTKIQQDVIQSSRFQSLPNKNRAKVLSHYAVVQLMDGDPSLGRSYLKTARKLAPGYLPSLVLEFVASMGRTPFQIMIRIFRRFRYWLQAAPSSTSIFLRHD